MTVRVTPHVELRPEDPFQGTIQIVHRADLRSRSVQGNHDVASQGLVALRGWYPLEVLHFPFGRSSSRAGSSGRSGGDPGGAGGHRAHMADCRTRDRRRSVRGVVLGVCRRRRASGGLADGSFASTCACGTRCAGSRVFLRSRRHPRRVRASRQSGPLLEFATKRPGRGRALCRRDGGARRGGLQRRVLRPGRRARWRVAELERGCRHAREPASAPLRTTWLGARTG